MTNRSTTPHELPECSCGFPKQGCLYGDASVCKQRSAQSATPQHYIGRALEYLRMDHVTRLDISDAIYNLERAIAVMRSASTATRGETPRTDYAATLIQFAVAGKDQYEVVTAEFARELERELAAAIKAGESVQREFNEYRRITQSASESASTATDDLRDHDTGRLPVELEAIAERLYEKLHAELHAKGINLPGCAVTDEALEALSRWTRMTLSASKSATESTEAALRERLRATDITYGAVEEMHMHSTSPNWDAAEKTLRDGLAHKATRSATRPTERDLLQQLIDYHDNQASGADAMDMAEAVKYHEKRRSNYEALLAATDSRSKK